VLAGRAQNRYFLCQAIAQNVLLLFEVKPRLEVEPKSLSSTKVARQAQRSIGCDSSGAMNNLVDAARRDADVLSHSILRHSHRLEEVVKQDFTWVYRRKLS